MKYAKGTANGDAGEFFAAYKVAKELGWPCRLYDIDIGIDAQVEVLDEDRESTGRFVALQVKAASAEEVDCRYVAARQLTYWRSLTVPVFVVLVNLVAETMYLHLVELDRDYETTKGGSRKIPFDLKADLFSKASAAVFREASERLAMTEIAHYLEGSRKGAEEIAKAVSAVRAGNPSPRHLIELMESRVEWLTDLGKAEALVRSLRVGGKTVQACRNQLEWALNDLQSEMDGGMREYQDEADIMGFLDESYAYRPD